MILINQTYRLNKNCFQMTNLNIIAEFKRKSPSKGWFNEKIRVSEVIPEYEVHGAAAISVLTDKIFFGGDT